MLQFLKSFISSCVAGALFFVLAAYGASSEIIGTAGKVVDGDTLWVCDQTSCHKIRLCGIEAPEMAEASGQEARYALKNLVKGRTVICTPVGDGTVCDSRSKSKSFDRTVAQCFIDEIDIGDALVSSGHACDWVRFSGGHYSRNAGGKACEK
jgi:endonuclease YncB( thermonuclease family)